ncbi:MAG: lactoylglutathione lyase [Porticoccaceae bacterium]|nr:MAG: lactoylglutathione lyase [Porticoccaceae bacterium]
MLSHVTLGTNDLSRAARFYEEVLAPLGGRVAFTTERAVFFAFGEGPPRLAVILPYDAQPATAGNGTMVALAAPTPEVVDEVHALALAQGGRDEGAPGVRGGAGRSAYAAYFRDLDGNKLGIFCAAG